MIPRFSLRHHQKAPNDDCERDDYCVGAVNYAGYGNQAGIGTDGGGI